MANNTRHMSQAQSAAKGIRDWALKKTALYTFFGQWGDRELAIAILGLPQIAASYTNAVESLRGSFKSWHEHQPSGATGRLFLTELVKRLTEQQPALAERQDSEIRSIIVQGTIRQFCELLPEKVQEIIDVQSVVPACAASQMGQANDMFHPQWILRNPPQESISAALTRGRIDQKFHYLSPDAEEIWRDVVNSGAYLQYDACKTALSILCGMEIWKCFFRDGGADGAVMLGCGAGTKDLLIIRSMLNLSQIKPLHYSLVDFSSYMLEAAYHQIDRNLAIERLGDRINLTMHKLDFVNSFAGAGRALTRQRRSVAWMLPGGTIGNLDEQRLFESLSAESQVGDLFVVGAETLDPRHLRDGDHLVEKYNTPEVRRFVEMPFRSVLRTLRIEETPPISVQVVLGQESGHSKVKESMTVEVSSMVRGQKIVLLTSTRYNEEEFVSFAAQKGFARETTISSPLNDRYKQFVFRRAPAL